MSYHPDPVIKTEPFYKREALLYFFVGLLSILLSLWVEERGIILNPDGICYLLAAEAMDRIGISGAMHLCGQAEWPFYSLLIYWLSKITALSYPVAAYSINGAFSLLSVLFFILIVKELGGRGRVLWLAALVILLSHEFNSIRAYVVRDHGFWAFYLGSIFFLLRFFKKPAWKSALIWNVFILIATLFRIEGLIFLIALPHLAWFYVSHPLKLRLHFFFLLNMMSLVVCIALIAWFFLHPQEAGIQLGRLPEVPHQIKHGFIMMSERFLATKIALAAHVLTKDSAKEAWLILLLVFFAWYLTSVIKNLSLMYGALCFYALKRNAIQFTFSTALVLVGYICINVFVTSTFLVERLFLSKRYLIALSLTLMLFIPFALDHLWQRWRRPSVGLALFAIVLAIFISLRGIFDFGYSKAYIREAGAWLAQHVPPSARLYANDYQLMYYSTHFGDQIFKHIHDQLKLNDAVAQGRFKQYDYLALRLDKKAKSKRQIVLKEIPLSPILVFANKRGDEIVIYKTH